MTEQHVSEQPVEESTPEPSQSEAVPSEQIDTGVDLDQVRDLVLAAHPDIVPEMVRGETFAELMDSVEPAREAYQRIVTEQRQSAGSAPRVAAQPGQRSTSVVDVDALSPLAKISEGLKRA